MKKLLAIILSISIVFAFAACGKKGEETLGNEAETNAENSGSVANILLDAFEEKAKNEKSALKLAEDIVANPVIPFAGGAVEVEEGYLTGFDDVEITGFKEGAMFSPMIGTIPFVGYVFTLDDEAEADGFIEKLEAAANLRWNICTAAEEMVTGSVGDKVFFVMSPLSFDEAE